MTEQSETDLIDLPEAARDRLDGDASFSEQPNPEGAEPGIN